MNPSSTPEADHSQVAAAALPMGWLVGAFMIALGAFGAFASFVAPLLFGPMVAAVIATDRLLRATLARDSRLIASWLVLAAGWIALAAFMLHSPLLSHVHMETGLTVLVLASGACWVWSRSDEGANRHVNILLVVAGSALALAILYGGGDMTIARISAAASVALGLVGLEWILMSIAGTAARALPPRRSVMDGREGGPLPAWTPRIGPEVRLPAEVL